MTKSRENQRLFETRASLLLLGALSLSTQAKSDPKALFEAHTYRAATGETLPYRLLVPIDFEKGKAQSTKANRAAEAKYPLVLFFHGAGERGSDNANQLFHGMSYFASPEGRRANPAFVVAPQCPGDKRWVEVDWSLDKHTMPKTPSDPMRLTVALLDDLMAKYPVDKSRVYVTGLSMGGFGVWDIVQRYPKRFAAAAPVCGGGDEVVAERIAQVPIWAFHGEKDTVVKPERSRNMIQALRAAGGTPKYTEYAGGGHGAWDPAYQDPELYKWLFAQKLAPGGG